MELKAMKIHNAPAARGSPRHDQTTMAREQANFTAGRTAAI
jgi:hypothetical protein